MKIPNKRTHLLLTLIIPLLLFYLLLYQSLKSPPPDYSISCDRSHFRTDICHVIGDLRTLPNSTSLFLLSPPPPPRSINSTSVRPYPRKWETNIMSSITQLHLHYYYYYQPLLPCHVTHPNATAVVLSTGGYTGNVFHEFNEGIIPLYLTTRHLTRDTVVLLILDYKNWWVSKYADVLSRISDHPPINLANQTKTHCFGKAIIGLNIRGDLDVGADPAGFRHLLDQAYRSRIRSLQAEDDEIKLLFSPSSSSPPPPIKTRPKLVIISRTGLSRVIENESEVVDLAESIGFTVEVLRPERTTELAKIYRALNASDAMIGVHGAAMTHLLFMRKGSVFVQIVPLGTDWAAESFYGEPARRMGVWYLGYKIMAEESSLWREYNESDPVLRDPNARGWEMTKRLYLDAQNVRLDLGRFGKRLQRAYCYLVANKTSSN